MSFKSFEQSVSESRIDELQREINFLARRLWLVQTEVEMNMPDIDYAEELKELVGEWIIRSKLTPTHQYKRFRLKGCSEHFLV